MVSSTESTPTTTDEPTDNVVASTPDVSEETTASVVESSPEVSEAEAPAAEAPVVEAPVVEAPKPAAVSNSRFSEAERTLRKERVTKAKDALARSVGVKGDHVAPARASLKMYLQRLNEPNQPDDARFELLINGPFTAPPKKKTNDRKF
jgi:hypothetical protein